MQYIRCDVLRVYIAKAFDVRQINVPDIILTKVTLHAVAAFFADCQNFDSLAKGVCDKERNVSNETNIRKLHN